MCMRGTELRAVSELKSILPPGITSPAFSSSAGEVPDGWNLASVTQKGWEGGF